ncbi:4a-hydroxytetrahydrobiopterin dehydratase [Massilia antarctica]|uniref:4a-hydroxytetrahydrobiopterin dehydratase n=1 Tax=Massilia antarctica TaxID=2765360 RepID=UPI0006BB89DD|nr:4a-hydroxytetrahydrobiopterin dehydratase [Massilia sp. H27-R4]MCY0914630.1 4a-hydroxytetrahydrobiopterin dehydratase [Massilia sp. H27-R4]CUI08344.1 Pterin-4-alpha-carbinolamine dehydratase [Janthinobacterium sp. CG23_2]CUU32130.1 Pterin-4-alpha-carbinolamine dehydratase [Janthinobacterium sp. CG23_2]
MSLLTRSCRADAAALAPDAIAALLPQVPGWSIADGKLLRSFTFKNYYDTMAFVNALAWISHHQDHHPELTVTYKECAVRYNTHSAGGALSDNDFICAAKANALFDQRSGA